MPVSEICTRNVVVVSRNETALEAARLMRRHHVGDVIVVEDSNGSKIPIGIVTDRDLVVEIMAQGIDPESLSVSEIMTSELARIEGGQGIFEAVEYMRSKGVRRLPVVGEGGALIGVLALDDLLELLAEELSGLSKLVKNEMNREARNRV